MRTRTNARPATTIARGALAAMTPEQIDALADLIAWMNDHQDNIPENYPGPQWARSDEWAGWTDGEVWTTTDAA